MDILVAKGLGISKRKKERNLQKFLQNASNKKEK